MTDSASRPIPIEARRIGVICPTWVGDTVMATPVFRGLAEYRPDAEVVAITRPPLAALVTGLDMIDDIVDWNPSGLAGPWRAGRGLARAGLDVLLLLPNSTRTALAAWCSRTPRRIGRAREGRGHLLTHALASPPQSGPVTTMATYVELASWALGVDLPPSRLELSTTVAEEADADRGLSGLGRPFVLVNPGANREDKRWPAERFAAAARIIADRHDLGIVVTGAPREASLVAAVTRLAGEDAVDLVARGVTLGSLKAVIRRAALLISNDTGPRHIALAFETPLVSLFGPTDHRWTNLEAARECVLVAEPFLPADLVADRHPRLCRIDRITVRDVVAAAATLLAGSPAAAPPAPRGTPPPAS